jgi:uroporphyrinogen decarboxylase
MLSYEGRNPRTTNFLKTIYFDYPDWTPCRVGLLPATWMKYRDDLASLVKSHPRIFPSEETRSHDFDTIANPLYEAGRHTDCWGTVWNNIEAGLDSFPETSPLADWAAWGSYAPPDPMRDAAFGHRDWTVVSRELQAQRSRGDIATGSGLMHGFMYMRLFYLRGFANFMMDLATDDPRLWQIISMVEGYNAAVICKYIDLGAEYMSFGDDLGLQESLPISPDMWRKFIKPSYNRMLCPCRETSIPVYLHTDGHILEIIPDLIEVGVTVLNPQFRANGLEGLKTVARGRVAIDQDLDRQMFPFGSVTQLEDHICEVHEALHLPEGGLMLIAECGPDVPLESIDTICTVLEDVCQLPEPD